MISMDPSHDDHRAMLAAAHAGATLVVERLLGLVVSLSTPSPSGDGAGVPLLAAPALLNACHDALGSPRPPTLEPPLAPPPSLAEPKRGRRQQLYATLFGSPLQTQVEAQADGNVLDSSLVEDMVAVASDGVGPAGYHRIRERMLGGDRAFCHALVAKPFEFVDRPAPVVVALAVAHPGRGEGIPPGFAAVVDARGAPADLSGGGEPAWLCVRKSHFGDGPLTDLGVTVGRAPVGHQTIATSPRGDSAGLGSASNIFVTYRQRMPAAIENLTRTLVSCGCSHGGDASDSGGWSNGRCLVDAVVAPSINEAALLESLEHTRDWRRPFLHPLCLALFERHRGVSTRALEGLQALLLRHSFFALDTEASSLLDLAVACVSDHVEKIAPSDAAPSLPLAFAFLRSAVAVTEDGRGLSRDALRRVVGSFSFACALSYSSDSAWRTQPAAPLLPPAHTGFTCLLSLSHSLLRAADRKLLATPLHVEHPLQSSASGIAEAVVWELVASAVAGSALRRTTDALLLSLRQGAKWLALQTAVADLCPDSQPALQRACLVFGYHCAVAMAAEGASSHAQAARQEVAMRAANDCLAVAPAAVRASAAWSYLVRRLCSSLVLAQLVPSLGDTPRLLAPLLETFTLCWRHYRGAMKAELAVIADELLLRAVRAKDVPAAARKEVLAAVVGLMDVHSLAETYVNFDLGPFVLQPMGGVEALCRTMASVAEGCSADADGVGLEALRAVASLTRVLMDLSASVSGWEEQAEKAADAFGATAVVERDDGPLLVSTGSLARDSFVVRTEDREKSRLLLAEGLQLYATKGSISKAVNFLVAKGYLSDSPRDVAAFLRIHSSSHFSPEAVGEFLGSGDVSDEVRLSYVAAIAFGGFQVEAALRHFLTEAHFRLPGEAQKVDRLIATFAKCFWSSRRADAVPTDRASLAALLQTSILSPSKPLLASWAPPSEDAVYLLAFALIMLNTDLHRVTSKKVQKMSQKEFVHNLQRSGAGVPTAELEHMYASVAAKPIQLPFPSPSDAATAPDGSRGSPEDDTLATVASATHRAGALLATLAAHPHFYSVLGPHALLSVRVVISVFKCVHAEVHALLETLLAQPLLPLRAALLCLDALQGALGACLCLGLVAEKAALVQQLAKLQRSRQTEAPPQDPQPWRAAIEACDSHGAVDCIAKFLLPVVLRLKASFQADGEVAARLAALQQVASRLEHGGRLLLGEGAFTRRFLKEGSLVKRCEFKGKLVRYRFFLFSDQLLYAHQSAFGGGTFKVHRQLLLTHLKAEANPAALLELELTHPLKSFEAIADSEAERDAWVAAIAEARGKVAGLEPLQAHGRDESDRRAVSALGLSCV